MSKELELMNSDEKHGSDDLTYPSKQGSGYPLDQRVLEAGDAPLGKVTCQSHSIHAKDPFRLLGGVFDDS